MPNGIAQPMGLDPTLQKYKQLQSLFGDPDPTLRAERFATGVEASSADLMRLLEESQQEPKRGLIDKLTPILEAVAFAIDRTSGNRRRREGAFGELLGVRGLREERAESKRLQKRQKFADQTSLMGLMAQGKTAAYEARTGAAKTKAQRGERRLKLAAGLQPKGATIPFGDKFKMNAIEAYNEAWRSVVFDENDNPDWGATSYPVKRALSEAASVLGYENPVTDDDAALTELETTYYKRAELAVKNSDMLFDDAQARESYISTLAKNMMLRDHPEKKEEEAEEDFDPADFLPAVEQPAVEQPSFESFLGLTEDVTKTAALKQRREAILDFLEQGFSRPVGGLSPTTTGIQIPRR